MVDGEGGAEDAMYTLPQCGHAFHTDCIMTWFRSNQTRCPLCNHNPELHDNYYEPRNRETALRIIRKRKADDPAINAEFKRLKTLQESAKKHGEARRTLQNLTLETALQEFGNVKIKELHKKMQKLRRDEMSASWRVRRQQRALANMVPIIPIVLPVRQPAHPPQPHSMQLRNR